MRMNLFRRLEFLVSLGCLAMLAYFTWYGLKGERGYAYRERLVAQQELLLKESELIQAQRRSIESRVALLRPESLDPDLMDELARRDLFLVKKNDIVVKLNP